MAGSLAEWNSRHPQIRSCIHWLHLKGIFFLRPSARAIQLDAHTWTPSMGELGAARVGGGSDSGGRAEKTLAHLMNPVHQFLVCPLLPEMLLPLLRGARTSLNQSCIAKLSVKAFDGCILLSGLPGSIECSAAPLYRPADPPRA